MTISFTSAGTLASSASAATLTPALPLSSFGDAMFAMITKSNSAPINTPSGWRKMFNQGGPSVNLEYTFFFAQYGLGVAAPVFTWSGAVACAAQVFGFSSDTGRGANIGAIGGRSAGATNPHTSNGITSTQATSLAVAFDCQLSSTAQATTPSGWSPLFANGDATSGMAFALWGNALSPQGTASGSISVTEGAVNWNQNQAEIIDNPVSPYISAQRMIGWY